jgi:NhaP-type Na+/H+ or K+/H+ antiporter
VLGVIGENMDTMWQTIIGGLALAAVTGLTIIAYRHPDGYARMYTPIVVALVAAWAAWFIGDMSYSSGYSEAILATIKLNPGAIIKTPTRETASFLAFLAPAVAYAYLGFLRLLPHLLREEKAAKGRSEHDA